MCLAASGTPVAVKCRAVEPVNKVKILPVQDHSREAVRGNMVDSASRCAVEHLCMVKQHDQLAVTSSRRQSSGVSGIVVIKKKLMSGS
jgi:hypothetical protein